MTISELENKFLDLHGREVHAFSVEMANVGFHRMADLLVSMLDSGAWRSFKDGLGTYAFLPGEFDYFLTQQGIGRDDVMKIPDVTVKARVEAAMDERRTGEEDYRRPVLQARAENPQRPGRPIEPFGITRNEAKALVNGVESATPPDHRPALGRAVRRWGLTDGRTKKAPSEEGRGFARGVVPCVAGAVGVRAGVAGASSASGQDVAAAAAVRPCAARAVLVLTAAFAE